MLAEEKNATELKDGGGIQGQDKGKEVLGKVKPQESENLQREDGWISPEDREVLTRAPGTVKFEFKAPIIANSGNELLQSIMRSKGDEQKDRGGFILVRDLTSGNVQENKGGVRFQGEVFSSKVLMAYQAFNTLSELTEDQRATYSDQELIQAYEAIVERVTKKVAALKNANTVEQAVSSSSVSSPVRIIFDQEILKEEKEEYLLEVLRKSKFSPFAPLIIYTYDQDHAGGVVKKAPVIKIGTEVYTLEDRYHYAVMDLEENELMLESRMYSDQLRARNHLTPSIPLEGEALIRYKAEAEPGAKLIEEVLEVTNPLLMMAILSPQESSPPNLVAVLQLQASLDAHLLRPWRLNEAMKVELKNEFDPLFDNNPLEITKLKANLVDLEQLSAQFEQALSIGLQLLGNERVKVTIAQLKKQISELSSRVQTLCGNIDKYQQLTTLNQSPEGAQRCAQMQEDLSGELKRLKILKEKILAFIDSFRDDVSAILNVVKIVKNLQEQMLVKIAEEVQAASDSTNPIDDAVDLDANQAYQNLQQINKILNFEADVDAYMQFLGQSEFAQSVSKLKSTLLTQVWDFVLDTRNSEVYNLEDLFQDNSDYKSLEALAKLANLELRIQKQLETLGNRPYKLFMPKINQAIATSRGQLSLEIDEKNPQGLIAISKTTSYQQLACMDQYLMYLSNVLALESQLKNYAKVFQGMDDKIAEANYKKMKEYLRVVQDSYGVGDIDLASVQAGYENLAIITQQLSEMIKALELDTALAKHTEVLRFKEEPLAKQIKKLRSEMFEGLVSSRPELVELSQSAYKQLEVLNANLAKVFELEVEIEAWSGILKSCTNKLKAKGKSGLAKQLEHGVMQNKESLIRVILEAIYSQNAVNLAFVPEYQDLQNMKRQLLMLETELRNADNNVEPQCIADLIKLEPKIEKIRVLDSAVIELRKLKQVKGFSGAETKSVMSFIFALHNQRVSNFPEAAEKLKALTEFISEFLLAKSELEILFPRGSKYVEFKASFVNLLEGYFKKKWLLVQADDLPAVQIKEMKNSLLRLKQFLSVFPPLCGNLGKLEQSPLSDDVYFSWTVKNFIAYRINEITAQIKNWDGRGNFSDSPSIKALQGLTTPGQGLSLQLEAAVAGIPKPGIWTKLKTIGSRISVILFGINSVTEQLSSSLEKQNSRILTENLQAKIKQFTRTEDGRVIEKSSASYRFAQALWRLVLDLNANVQGQSTMGSKGDTLRNLDAILAKLLSQELGPEERVAQLTNLAAIFQANEDSKVWWPFGRWMQLKSKGATLCEKISEDILLAEAIKRAAVKPQVRVVEEVRPPIDKGSGECPVNRAEEREDKYGVISDVITPVLTKTEDLLITAESGEQSVTSGMESTAFYQCCKEGLLSAGNSKKFVVAAEC